MSAVLESVASPVDAARGALDEARRELASCDERIRGYEAEVDSRELERQRHVVAIKIAVSENRALPKAPKVKASDADVALPILRGKRKEFTERVAECEGRLRRAAVEEVALRYAASRDAFAIAAGALIEAWRELIGARQLLDQAGIGATVEPLPMALYTDFAIPALGRLRPISTNHWAHFVASHAAAQGELFRATDEVRVAVERDIGMKLPW